MTSDDVGFCFYSEARAELKRLREEDHEGYDIYLMHESGYPVFVDYYTPDAIQYHYEIFDQFGDEVWFLEKT